MSDNKVAEMLGAGKTSSTILMVEGIVLIVLGIFAILVPGLFTFAVETLIAIVLIVGGLIRGYSIIKEHSTRSVVWSLLGAIVAIVAGVLLFLYPVLGVLSLTAILIALFIIEGITKIVASFHLNKQRGWGWVLFTGILDVALGFILWIGLPETALWAIGLLVGISLVFSGWTAVMFAGALKHSAKTP